MDMNFDGMEIFSASKHMDREKLGKNVTEWRARNPTFVITDVRFTQSSDNEFHCVTVAVFYKTKK